MTFAEMNRELSSGAAAGRADPQSGLAAHGRAGFFGDSDFAPAGGDSGSNT
jgi:hypothetical protein